MTGIAAVLAPRGDDARASLKILIKAMDSRGSVPRSTVVTERDRTIAVGSCSHKNEQSLAGNPEETSVVVDGIVPESLEIDEIGGQVSERSLSEALKSSQPFSSIAISEGRLLAVRDILGQKPLYYGTASSGRVAVASLKTALERIGIQDSKPVPPGRSINVSDREPTVMFDGSLRKPEHLEVSEEEASKRLAALLVDSLSREVPRDLALAFSGGLDSTLVAQAAKENDLRPELVTVGIKGQQEVRHAHQVSKRLGLDITVRELSESEILETLPQVVSTVESFDPIIVGVSVPLYFACEIAETIGADCILAGQLSDELFAGYGRFDDLATKKDPQSVQDEVWRSVLAASVNDFEPGDKLATSHRLQLRCPFAFVPFVEYALRLPASLKLRMIGGRVVRKYILRKVASNWGLPATVSERPKKAVQYSTGVQRVLLREAKKRKMSLSSLLKTYA